MTGSHALHYTEWGRRNAARTVVCVHGYSGNSRDFDVLAKVLARDARVICLDVAGRGESDWLPSPLHYHFGQFIADIEALIAHLEVKEVDWVGTSMGGLLGMLLASRASSPVRRLVINDVGAFVPMDALAQIGRNLQAPARFDSLAQVEAHLRHTHREWGEITDAQYRHLTKHHARATADGGFRLHYDPQITRLIQPFPLAPGVFFWDTWYRVQCPVLLVRGDRSEVLPAAVADAMLEIKPGTELVEIPGAGHAPALMSPLETGIVREFLRETVSSSRTSERDSRRSAAA
jgi:pimeloyl-ACP methyl ester carboxylesterase